MIQHLPKNADVNLTFSVPAANGVVHDFTVPALGIHVVANPGETRTVGLRGLPAGRYGAFCSVPGHAEAGMRVQVPSQPTPLLLACGDQALAGPP